MAGRFLSVDPVVTDANTGGSFNRYNYANNNPYLFTDPDGRCGVREGLGCYTTVFPEGPNDTNAGDSGLSGYSRVLARNITERGFITGKHEADLLYLTNSDPNLTVTVDASMLKVTALGEWKPDPNGGLKAPGYVNGLAYWVHGQITIRSRPDGTYGIYNQSYHYNMHMDFSIKGIARNIATFFGKPPTFWPLKSSPYIINYRGNTNLTK